MNANAKNNKKQNHGKNRRDNKAEINDRASQRRKARERRLLATALAAVDDDWGDAREARGSEFYWRQLA